VKPNPNLGANHQTLNDKLLEGGSNERQRPKNEEAIMDKVSGL
jgi:hypothetical protein